MGNAASASPSGLRTRKLAPHLGQRILSPDAGTRRSSISYGALHPSHSTLNMLPRSSIHLSGFGVEMFYHFELLQA
jgi:hypothetical protein